MGDEDSRISAEMGDLHYIHGNAFLAIKANFGKNVKPIYEPSILYTANITTVLKSDCSLTLFFI